MEAVFLHSSSDQSISPYKHLRNPKKNNRPLILRPSDNFAPSKLPLNFHGGLLYSFPPSVSLLNPQQQPPLLPLPISKPYNKFRSRGFSRPPINRTRDQSLTPKESNSSISPKKEYTKQDLKSTTSECLIVASTNRLGPDPMDLPKHVSRVLSSSSSSDNNNNPEFSGSMFTLSPPPSSLPLPTFSLRPKLSCKAEAAGVDAGATDSLRRLLRLR
uniref:Uncharacterized protein n=1 Tax=Davidia involucrata TaxID=16924 RepID=A0A5B7ASR8_DAVIN